MKYFVLITLLVVVYGSHADTNCTASPNDICSLPAMTGMCRGYFRVYAYNTTSNACELFVYGGCGGNGNRFDTLLECQEACES